MIEDLLIDKINIYVHENPLKHLAYICTLSMGYGAYCRFRRELGLRALESRNFEILLCSDEFVTLLKITPVHSYPKDLVIVGEYGGSTIIECTI